MTPAQLRQVVFELAGGQCEWPHPQLGRCPRRAVELAHLTSRGMGGSKYRNTISNGMAACRDHARISDGLPPLCGGVAQRDREYRRVPGAEPEPDGSWRTRSVVEALRVWLAAQPWRQSVVDSP